ncbi:glycosyltransferase family 4 protein [Rhizobium sp. BK251]|uniref:glycosyltransferase family 4 protein n=1 Tax=Rhizobium sp. BK251 TaxID=2512125 RepID=UPI001050F38D|nr:glycosyltransferase family 4 protein [Rhizobium sp. BK251]TCL72982.1 glycosyltransferase involved in cell wall biosynthesis [Rhizobium sp. BK251]
MKTVSVIYHFFPHYRAPIMRKLAASKKYNYEFYGSLHNTSGIKVFSGDENIKINPIEFELRGSRWVLRGFMKAVLKKDVEVVIVHGHPNMPASWIISVVARLTGRKIIYWAHGWLYKEVFWKRIIRNLHFSLANAVMTYGERAVTVAKETGYWRNNIFPIGNSLDWDKRCDIIDDIASQTQYRGEMTRKYFGSVERPLIICSARITKECRQDILIAAAQMLKDRGREINILLIGDGPERRAIETMARDFGVSVYFFGACYDEEVVGLMTYHSDITVSPGKVGLTAMQSMMYGTPVITHNDFDKQMPEFEAVRQGVTGDFFEYNDPSDLADKIEGWLARATDREDVRRECFAEIERRWTPEKQMQMIEHVIDSVVGEYPVGEMVQSGSRRDSEHVL